MKEYSLQERILILQEIVNFNFPNDKAINKRIVKLVKTIDNGDVSNGIKQLNATTKTLQTMATHKLGIPCSHRKFEENPDIIYLNDILELKDELIEVDDENLKLFHKTFLSALLSGVNFKHDFNHYKSVFSKLLLAQESQLGT